MGRKMAAGVVAGLIGGLVFSALMRVVPVAAAGPSMIAFAADVAHAANPMVGWLVYPVYGVVIGALFGALLRGQTLGDIPGALWGVAYGVGWWIIAELVLVPARLGGWSWSASAFGAALVHEAALPLLAGHVVYGVILGVTWSRITGWDWPRQGPRAVGSVTRRAA